MRKIGICDVTLNSKNNSNVTIDFKEKVEIARNLARLNVSAIMLPFINNSKENEMLVSTISAFVNNVTISVPCGISVDDIKDTAKALKNTAKPQISLNVPVSAVQMEYYCHKKPNKMLELIPTIVGEAKASCNNIEFCAVDATRADKEFLKDVILKAIKNGADKVCVCDTAGDLLPEDFGAFVAEIKEYCNVPLGVMCSNELHLANASEICAIKNGADYICTSVNSDAAGKTDRIIQIIEAKSDVINANTSIVTTEMNRAFDRIIGIVDRKTEKTKSVNNISTTKEISIKSGDGLNKISNAIKSLGYDLSADDTMNVFEAINSIAQNRVINAIELDAIIASNAMQVPATYKLKSYVINSGNIIDATANVYLQKGNEVISGISIGDGPIDAAFLAIEQIIGHHFELDDFNIQSVTEGREAMGVAIVRLRNDGVLYSGKGTSTDIIEASIYAYINAVNKITDKEAN